MEWKMKQYVGRACTIHIRKGDRILYFTAKVVTAVTDSHITFVDKYDDVYTHRVEDVEEIILRNREVKRDDTDPLVSYGKRD